MMGIKAKQNEPSHTNSARLGNKKQQCLQTAFRCCC